MSTKFWESLIRAIEGAIYEILLAAIGGWYLYMAVLIGRHYLVMFETLSWKKVVFISIPKAIAISLFFAFFSYVLWGGPDESSAENLYNAQLTFFCVFIPLTIGCVLGWYDHVSEDTVNEKVSRY